jgi:hypothetical protein
MQAILASRVGNSSWQQSEIRHGNPDGNGRDKVLVSVRWDTETGTPRMSANVCR